MVKFSRGDIMKEMLFKNGVDKALTFSYDDGLPTDIRLAGIFDRNGLKATFNINSGLSACAEGVPLPETLTKSNMWTRTSLTALKETFANSSHEIALHGTKHYHPEELDEKGAEEEFASDKAALEQVFGKVVRGCAYAFGTYGDAARNELRKLGTAVRAVSDDADVWVAAANGERGGAVMIANDSDRPVELALDLAGRKAVSHRLTDCERTDERRPGAPGTLGAHAFCVILCE